MFWDSSFAKIGLFFFCSQALGSNAAVLKLDDYIQALREKSLVQKDISTGFQKSEAAIYAADIAYDTFLNAKFTKEDSKAESMAGLSNPQDKTEVFSIGVGKKFRTGSYLGVDYGRIFRDSILDPKMAAFLSLTPTQYQNSTVITFKQDLLNNAFGFQDQIKKEVAILTKERAQFERDEALEDMILNGVKLYWDTYLAQENLKQNISARDKFQLLYKNIQTKHSMGFDDRSELLKTQAELQNQERNIKSAKLYLSILTEKLYSLAQLPMPAEVEVSEGVLVVPPSESTEANKASGKLIRDSDLSAFRKIQSAEMGISISNSELEIAKNSGKPSLNFIAQGGFYGLDKDHGPSFEEMNSATKPKYLVGLEFSMRFDNSQEKAETLTKRLQYEDALNQKEKLKIQIQESMVQTNRNVQMKYLVYNNAVETSKVWDKVIQNQERSHRLGRLTTSELLMDYGSFFRNRASQSQALADYKLALFDYQAVRDQLIKN
jgi:outer membrane protein TolC